MKRESVFRAYGQMNESSSDTKPTYNVIVKEDGQLVRYSFEDEEEFNEFRLGAMEDGTYWGVERKHVPANQEVQFRTIVKR
jgi:hypothetical protein